MKKFLSILSLSLLLMTNIFGQPMVDIPLYANDGTYTIPLAVGTDPTATNGIDPQLGESDLPPFPPIGAFEIRFDLTSYTGEALSSYKDYRYAISPFIPDPIEHKLWWQLGNYGNSIEIQYQLPYFAWMWLKDELTGTFLNLGPFYGTGTAVIPWSYTMIFNKCLLIMSYAWIPVELTSFNSSVLQNERAVQLNWTTATETNNSGFEVERASSRTTPRQEGWETIGFVPGFGTTTEPKSYSFTDENVTNGTYKYRLKQIDFNGSFEYSNEIEIKVDLTPKEFVLYQNYPNPFNPNTVISYQLPVSSNVTLKVYDILGNEVTTLVNGEKQPGVYEVEFNSHSGEVRNLTSGVYFYQLKAGSFSSIKKMVLLK